MMTLTRKEQLQRLIMGLQQSIESTRGMLPYYEKGDIEGVYAKKFLASMEEQLIKTRAELEALERAGAE